MTISLDAIELRLKAATPPRCEHCGRSMQPIFACIGGAESHSIVWRAAPAPTDLAALVALVKDAQGLMDEALAAIEYYDADDAKSVATDIRAWLAAVDSKEAP